MGPCAAHVRSCPFTFVLCSLICSQSPRWSYRLNYPATPSPLVCSFSSIRTRSLQLQRPPLGFWCKRSSNQKKKEIRVTELILSLTPSTVPYLASWVHSDLVKNMAHSPFISLFLAFLLTSHGMLVSAIDPGEDFAGYMEDIERRRQDEENYRDVIRAHEEWRQNTWGGWFTRQLMAIGNHFAPFLVALADAIGNEGDSAGSMALIILLRVLVIGCCVVGVYAFSSIINLVLGREIVIEQVVIIEEDDENEGTAESTSESKKSR